jgi:hypothetical protein
MKPTATVNARGFSMKVKDLAKLGGVSVDQALRAEVGKVLEKGGGDRPLAEFFPRLCKQAGIPEVTLCRW